MATLCDALDSEHPIAPVLITTRRHLSQIQAVIPYEGATSSVAHPGRRRHARLMALAVVESSPQGALRGVWVEAAADRPQVAFHDPHRAAIARRHIEEARPAVERHGRTWTEFLHHLLDRQHPQVVQRIKLHTGLQAPELLAEVTEIWPHWNAISQIQDL